MKKLLLNTLFLTLFGVLILGAQDHVSVYSGCDFNGDRQRMYEGEYNDKDLTIGNDRISSIRVPEGWSVTVYKSNNFDGSHETYTSDVRCLPEKFNDAISSVRVERGGGSGGFGGSGGSGGSGFGGSGGSSKGYGATVYKDCSYGGTSAELKEGTYKINDLRSIGNDQISSLKVNSGYEVILYPDDSFRGQSFRFTKSERCLPSNINDKTSSLVIRKLR